VRPILIVCMQVSNFQNIEDANTIVARARVRAVSRLLSTLVHGRISEDKRRRECRRGRHSCAMPLSGIDRVAAKSVPNAFKT
jgi:hypothetical protein